MGIRASVLPRAGAVPSDVRAHLPRGADALQQLEGSIVVVPVAFLYGEPHVRGELVGQRKAQGRLFQLPVPAAAPLGMTRSSVEIGLVTIYAQIQTTVSTPIPKLLRFITTVAHELQEPGSRAREKEEENDRCQHHPQQLVDQDLNPGAEELAENLLPCSLGGSGEFCSCFGLFVPPLCLLQGVRQPPRPGQEVRALDLRHQGRVDVDGGRHSPGVVNLLGRVHFRGQSHHDAKERQVPQQVATPDVDEQQGGVVKKGNENQNCQDASADVFHAASNAL
mmetsp:Transcript_2992/g.7114  ORF Transcript_2992/g.7114 Transcript_2992/m.7114 type:complete len:279 (+) Transcript_2992:777-1613(+)